MNDWRWCPRHWTQTLWVKVDEINNWACSNCLADDLKRMEKANGTNNNQDTTDGERVVTASPA